MSRVDSFDDARIKEDVAGALNADHIYNVTVSVSGGRVMLVGTVPNALAREGATRDAERVAGVVAVDNRIEVRP